MVFIWMIIKYKNGFVAKLAKKTERTNFLHLFCIFCMKMVVKASKITEKSVN